MSGRLVLARPEPDESLVRSGTTVRADTWFGLGLLADWLRAGGFGAQVVAGTASESTLTSGAERVLNFRCKPRGTCIQRVWIVKLRAATAAASTVVIKAPASTGTASSAIVVPNDVRAMPIVYIETLSAKTNTTAGLSIGINPTGANVVVDGITCFELPRPVLALDTTDYGVDAESERVGERIYSAANRSIVGVRDALINADARRVNLFSWAIPDGGTLYTRTSASYLGGAGIFALGMPILARKLASGATTASVKWNVYAKITGGATGKVKLTTSQSAVSSEISVTGASLAWQTDTAVSVHCDDMDSADGRQTAASPVWDEMTFDFKSDGAATLSIAAISVWEE